MASTLETVDKKTGALDAPRVVNSEITKLISELYVYKEMLPAERTNEKDIIEGIRNSLVELRLYLDRHFQYKEIETGQGQVK